MRGLSEARITVAELVTEKVTEVLAIGLPSYNGRMHFPSVELVCL